MSGFYVGRSWLHCNMLDSLHRFNERWIDICVMVEDLSVSTLNSQLVSATQIHLWLYTVDIYSMNVTIVSKHTVQFLITQRWLLFLQPKGAVSTHWVTRRTVVSPLAQKGDKLRRKPRSPGHFLIPYYFIELHTNYLLDWHTWFGEIHWCLNPFHLTLSRRNTTLTSPSLPNTTLPSMLDKATIQLVAHISSKHSSNKLFNDQNRLQRFDVPFSTALAAVLHPVQQCKIFPFALGAITGIRHRNDFFLFWRTCWWTQVFLDFVT